MELDEEDSFCAERDKVASNNPHKGGSSEVKSYCIVMDIKAALNTYFLPLLWSHSDEGDGDIFVKKDGSMGISGFGLDYTDAGFVQADWNRIVINADLSNMQLDFYCVYPDGTKKESKKKITNSSRFSLQANSFSDIFRDNGNEDGDAHIAQLAIFNTFLSEDELEQILVPWVKE